MNFLFYIRLDIKRSENVLIHFMRALRRTAGHGKGP